MTTEAMSALTARMAGRTPGPPPGGTGLDADWPDTHRYWLRGAAVPSVTTIIGEALPSPELALWQERTPDHQAITARAATFGTWVHELTEWADRHPDANPFRRLPELPACPELVADRERDGMACLRSWVEHRRAATWDVWAIEAPVVGGDGDARWAGTIDRVVRCADGAPTILDIKTGRVHEDRCRLQLAGYAAAVWSLTDGLPMVPWRDAQTTGPPRRGVVAHVTPAGVTEHQWEIRMADLTAWSGLVHVHRWQRTSWRGWEWPAPVSTPRLLDTDAIAGFGA